MHSHTESTTITRLFRRFYLEKKAKSNNAKWHQITEKKQSQTRAKEGGGRERKIAKLDPFKSNNHCLRNASELEIGGVCILLLPFPLSLNPTTIPSLNCQTNLWRVKASNFPITNWDCCPLTRQIKEEVEEEEEKNFDNLFPFLK